MLRKTLEMLLAYTATVDKVERQSSPLSIPVALPQDNSLWVASNQTLA